MALAGLIIIPFYRHVVGMSAYEYLGALRVSGAGLLVQRFCSGTLSKMGFVFYLPALTVTSITGRKTDSVIILVGIITVCYTLIGGIEAVIWADVIQGFVLWLGIPICLGYLLFLPAGGPAPTPRFDWIAGFPAAAFGLPVRLAMGVDFPRSNPAASHAWFRELKTCNNESGGD